MEHDFLPFLHPNIFQTWSYAALRSGADRISQIVLKERGRVVAAAEARIVKVPLSKFAMVNVRWGPLWKLRGEESREEVLRQIARGLQNEYVYRRGWAIDCCQTSMEETGSQFGRPSKRKDISSHTTANDIGQLSWTSDHR